MSARQGFRRVPVEVLHSFGTDILSAVGLAQTLAAPIAQSLVSADARSITSHGVVRLLPEYIRRLEQGSTNCAPRIQTVTRRGGSALLDADGAPGQIAGNAAMDMAIEMAGDQGIAAVGVRHSSHFGMGALYVERATAANMIGIALTNATPNMPPAGGRGRFLGTNPLAIGVPHHGGDPLVLDMSTSVVARGKIVMAEKDGRPIPPGWAIDVEGNPTTDPITALSGAVLPIAGYKGSGLALMIDVLTGVLTGAGFGTHVVDLYDKSARKQDVGHFFLAVDVASFMPVEAFFTRIKQYISEIRDQPRLPGVERIYLPGELEFVAERRAETEGIGITSVGIAELNALARRWKVATLDERLLDKISSHSKR